MITRIFIGYTTPLSVLRLNSRNGDGSHDIGDLAASRKVVDGFRKALADRSDRHKAAQTFYEFITDIARVEVGKNKHVRMPRNGRRGRF